MKEYDFYIVPTPIGNLGDITLRAVEILKTVDLIACEDSRNTQKLLNHYNIPTKCISYHKYNEKERVSQMVSLLEQGKKIALVSDAGTPLICDPGAVIVKELRKRGYSVTALAGANAIATFLSQISREDEKFSFIGFLPKTQKQIEEILNQYKYQDTIFYESPNRILNTLNSIKQLRPNAKIAIGRELTKLFEEVCQEGDFSGMEMEDKVKLLQNKGFSAKDISIILSELYGINKNKIYKISVGK